MSNPIVDCGTKRWFNSEGKLHRIDGPAVEYANGSKEWFQNGDLHRVGGPAAEYANGIQEWWINGSRHRIDGPAVEHANGSEWFLNGKRHREDGPAIEDVSGYKEWYQNGQLHRENGPAMEFPSGEKHWYQNGLMHREDGPAIERADGSKEWWTNGAPNLRAFPPDACILVNKITSPGNPIQEACAPDDAADQLKRLKGEKDCLLFALELDIAAQKEIFKKVLAVLSGGLSHDNVAKAKEMLQENISPWTYKGEGDPVVDNEGTKECDVCEER